MFLKLCYMALCITPEDSPSLKCNTTKDRVKLNYSTAGKNNNKTIELIAICIISGILAGVWPCGTIIMLGELFTSESMTQVYAFLHTFMHENAEALTGLSVYLL